MIENSEQAFLQFLRVLSVDSGNWLADLLADLDSLLALRESSDFFLFNHVLSLSENLLFVLLN